MEELDVVELLYEVDGWKPGTIGTVVELWDDRAMIEISNDDGETLDMPMIALDQAKVVWVFSDHREPGTSATVTGTSREVPAAASPRSQRR
jgi:hypothetical protein